MGPASTAEEPGQSMDMSKLPTNKGIVMVLNHFDKMYATYMDIVDEKDSEQAFHEGHKQPQEQFLEYTARRLHFTNLHAMKTHSMRVSWEIHSTTDSSFVELG